MTYGYMGKILRLDLTHKKAVVETLSEDIVKRFIGGRGLGAKILWDELSPGVDPLSPENKLVLTVGPLTGTKAQSASRWIAQFKSPLTGTYFRSVGGGAFGAELKFAGYDAVIVQGKAEKPIYVFVSDDSVEFRDAVKLWGMNTLATMEFLKEETDRKAHMVMIGPAGENLVRFAAIVTDEDFRTASRGGGGAVMGSKNLKAIVVKGSKKPEVYDEGLFGEVVKEQIESYRKNPGFEGFHNLGTNFAVYPFYMLGHFPTYNFKQKELEGVERYQAEELAKYVVRHSGCYNCMIRCGKTFKVTQGPYAGTVWPFPEYETHWSFGGNLGNINVEAVIYANMLCDLYGLDTISTGVAIGFAIELYEKGLIGKSETDGLELRWGDPDIIPELVRRIALRIGIGNLLAEGTRKAAEMIGRGAERYAIQVKGLELPAYDPRSAKAHGLSFITSPIGASHCIGWNKFEIMGIPKKVDPFATEGKAELAKYVQDETAIAETAVFCIFPFNMEMITVDMYARMLYAVTGIKEFGDPKFLWQVGERIFNLERAINAREGLDARYDKMPVRIVKEPVPREPSKGQVFEEEVLLKDYYIVRGWNEKGIPTSEKLRELGLEEVVGKI